ncbi:MAG: tetratricopeptide repeat protein [Betaproteobacteria bacterium]
MAANIPPERPLPAPPPTPATLAERLDDAIVRHRQGDLADAERRYREILALDPAQPDALHLLGVVLHQTGRHEAAVDLIRRALAIVPDDANAHSNLGLALRRLGRPVEALASFDRALALRPAHGGTLRNRGDALMAMERYADALASYDRSLAAVPDVADTHFGRGNALAALHREHDALASYDRALLLQPGHAAALKHRGDALAALGRHGDALSSYDRALALEPDDAGAQNNRGNVLLDLARPDEALASYDRALALAPDDVETLVNRGNALLALNRNDAALASYDRALARAPGSAAALYNRGNALWDVKRHGEALASYDRALAVAPTYADAWSNRGNVLLEMKRYDEAALAFARVVALEPGHAWALGNLAACRQHGCEWDDVAMLTPRIAEAVERGERAALPFAFLALSPSPAAQLACARIHVAATHAGASNPLWTGQRYAHDRIRVAYLSGDFHEHATAYLMAGLFEAHDRQRFETTAASFGPDTGDAMRDRLRRAFDRFVDVRGMSDRDAARLLREMEIDIAVDLKGFTRDSRPGILAHRPAPVQVSWLGYPGTMGAGWIDYIIADARVIPAAADVHYAERVVRLPDTYQVNDRTRRIDERTPTRAECGLPESGFVFCSFNNSYKITPDVFDVWMRLLTRVPGSVLWLLEGNATAARNLRREAERRGVAPERLVFAPRMPAALHLARHRLADLFLDTLPVNAHTTASDALWAGLPVLTCVGVAFAGRVAASLLDAVGLPELIVDRLADYEARALELATTPAALSALRDRLARNRTTHPLFDTDRFRRHLEGAYVMMRERAERAERGEAPTSFGVASLPPS